MSEGSVVTKLALAGLALLVLLGVLLVVVSSLFVKYGGYCRADILENSYEAVGIAKRYVVDHHGTFLSAEVRNLRFVDASHEGPPIQETPGMWTFDLEVKRLSPRAPAEADIQAQVYQLAVTTCGEVLRRRN
jgi:hypothetical protein